jgi:hypothetical protein
MCLVVTLQVDTTHEAYAMTAKKRQSLARACVRFTPFEVFL